MCLGTESEVFIEFPFCYTIIPKIGRIFNPTIPIILNTIDKGRIEINFIVDTGADLTTIPYFIAEKMGIDLSNCPEGAAEGLGGCLVKTWESEIEIIIGNYPLKVRCSITKDNKTPPLLGRVDILETRFNLHIDSRKKKIIFESI